MNSVESKIYEEVKSRCLSPNNAYGIGAWDHHIKLVYELAKNNAESYGADKEIVAHFYSVPSLLSMVYREKKLSIDEGAEFVKNKLNRSYSKLSSKGKTLVEQQYEAAKLLLK